MTAEHAAPFDDELDLPPETEEEVYRTLVRALRRKRGFGLYFVQCSPSQGEQVIVDVQKDLPQKRVQVLRLDRSSETVYDRVEALWQEQPFDILFITGMEEALYAYEDTKRLAGWTSEQIYSYSWAGVPRILSHLNLQRERFRDSFNCCFVFLVPLFVVKYFIQRAPDFFDWRSGLFTFPRSFEETEEEFQRLLEDSDYEKYKSLTLEECIKKLAAIQELLEEPHLISEKKARLLREQGRILVAVEEYRSAISSYDKAVELKPNYHEAWYNRGNALRNLNRYEEAIASYDKAIEFKPDKYEAWFSRGVALSILGRNKEAVASFDKVIEFKPDKYEVWHNRGNTLYHLGHYKEAVASFDQAIRIKPDDYQTWNTRGGALYHLGQYAEAIVSCDKAIEIKPDYHLAWNNRGSTLGSLGHYDEAVINFDQAIALNFNDSIAWCNRGVALQQLGRYEEALQSYSKALELNAKQGRTFYNQSCCYSLWGKLDEAIESLQQAIALNPENRELAKTDSDFDNLRQDPRFQALVADQE